MWQKLIFWAERQSQRQRGIYEAGEWLLEKAKDLKVASKPLDNLLQGRDLIALGLTPSPWFKKILDEVYSLCRLEGVIQSKEEALAYVKREFVVS